MYIYIIVEQTNKHKNKIIHKYINKCKLSSLKYKKL